MHNSQEYLSRMTRRSFLGRNSTGVGIAALAGLLGRDLGAATAPRNPYGGLPGLPHFPPTAKRVIYLFQSGGPSQIELFDYKPRLKEFQGIDLPPSIRAGQRLAEMSALAGQLSGSAFQVRVRATRRVRSVGERAASGNGQDRRSAYLSEIRQYGGDQSRSRCDDGADRLSSRRQARNGRMGRIRYRLRNRGPITPLLRFDFQFRRRPAVE